jgi:hypothetical protein
MALGALQPERDFMTAPQPDEHDPSRGEHPMSRKHASSRRRLYLEALEDRTLMSATLVSVNQFGTASGNGRSEIPEVLSANGRFVAFSSRATDLTAVPDGNGTGSDLFVRDLQASTTSLVSINAAGTALVDVNAQAENLDNLSRALTVNGNGTDALIVNDQQTTANQTYTVTASTLDRTGAARMTFSNVQNLVLNSGSSTPWNTYVDVQGTAAGTSLTVNTGSGNSISIGNAGSSLDDIQGPVTIQGQLNDNFSIADCEVRP